MKNKIAQILMLVVLTVGFAAFANAQTGKVHRATIPFDFIVGDKSFGAGEYAVNFGVSTSIRDTFLLRSADGKQSAIINQTVSKSGDKNLKQTNFVFYVSNGHYHLAEINTAQKSIELRSSRSKNKTEANKYELAMAR